MCASFSPAPKRRLISMFCYSDRCIVSDIDIRYAVTLPCTDFEILKVEVVVFIFLWHMALCSFVEGSKSFLLSNLEEMNQILPRFFAFVTKCPHREENACLFWVRVQYLNHTKEVLKLLALLNHPTMRHTKAETQLESSPSFPLAGKIRRLVIVLLKLVLRADWGNRVYYVLQKRL